MRILIISNTPFLPVTAGNRARINQMVQYLLEHGADVGMLMLPAADLAEWDVEAMRARLSYFEIATPPAGASPAAIRTATFRRLVGPMVGRIRRAMRRPMPRPQQPIGVDDWCPLWFRACTTRVTEEWAPDVAVIEYVFLSACLEHFVKTPTHSALRVIDTHDIMHRRREEYTTAGLAPQWFHTTYAEERRGLGRADVVLAISEADASVLREMLPQGTVLTVPHGYAVQPAPSEEPLPHRLLFVASYNDLNVRGLQWFLDEVWPQLSASAPDVELVVCGNICEKLGAVPAGVSVRGFVPSLAAEYARARVVINPVHAGTGLKVKIIEALCHGRPVVSTRSGTAGIGAGGAKGVVVADTASEFGAAVRHLFDDSSWHTRLSAAATAHATRYFSPEAAFAPLMGHLAALLSDRRGYGYAPTIPSR